MSNAIDNKEKSVYIWYSPATDKTGKNLAAALKAQHGSEKPKDKDIGLVIGWGTKVNEKVLLNAKTILNHPNSITANRNKLGALQIMLDKKVNVAPFITADKISDIGKKKSGVMLPLIGREKYHQGGKGFWNCPTMSQVTAAINDGAQYFQNLIEIKDEYRLHVFCDNVIYAVKKVKRTEKEMQEAFVKQELERQKSLAEKNKDPFDIKTAELIMRRQAAQIAKNGADMIIRSNRLGWKFSRVHHPEALGKEAIKAVRAVGLDFGAVDCCVDVNDKAWIIEVNSGPGLEESTFEAWVQAFKSKTVEKSAGSKRPEASKSTDKKLAENSLPITDKEELKKKVDSMSGLMGKMIDAADTAAEVATIDKLFSKLFKG